MGLRNNDEIRGERERARVALSVWLLRYLLLQS